MNPRGVERSGAGRDPWGSGPTLPDQPCGSVVQGPVQEMVQASGVCTTDRTTSTITLAGVRGGAGTSTIAVVLALVGRTMVPTELVAAEVDQTAALLAVTPDGSGSAEILPGLRLATAPTGSAELVIIDAGTLTDSKPVPQRPGERRLGVLRGPCYLALRSLLSGGQHGLDGLVLLAQSGRALTERDVCDVTGLDVVATVPASAAVARAIDAGLLATRVAQGPEFRSLQRWLAGQLEPFPLRTPLPTPPAPIDPPRTGTDLLGALRAPS